MNQTGGIETDTFGRMDIAGVYAGGDNSIIQPSRIIIASAEGSRAAMGVVSDLINDGF